MTDTQTDRQQRSEAQGLAHCSRSGDLAIVRLGAEDESMVTFTKERLESLDRIIGELIANPPKGVIITGPGPGMFAAGADIKLIQDVQSIPEGVEAAERGREIFRRLRTLPCPVVAAIEGPCLGGGFELALFCDVRVASDHSSTRLGLPEVKLGIIPGFGGTQNLTRLVGLPVALDWILKGKTAPAEAAFRKGLVDRVAPASRLLDAAVQEARRLIDARKKAPTRKLRGSNRWLTHLAPLRALVARKVRKTLETGQARFYEAPKSALELCLKAVTVPEQEGFDAEAQALGERIVSPSCKGLVHLFFLTERAKKLAKGDGARSVERALVVGGGVMGAGIGALMAGKGVRTRLCDLSLDVLAKAKGRLQKDLDKQVRRRRKKRHQAQAIQDNLAVSTEWGDLRHYDLWLEAVVEDLSLKQSLMARAVDAGLPADAVIATNTSSLPVDAMAHAVPHPERVVGVHFFNPPEKMPLVEVIRGARTSDAAVASACKLAVRLGKFPVVVGDAPGFLVNRCLAPYLNEAAELMLEGCEPEYLDKVLLDFGMPMGPARLLDEVGWDVATKVSEVLHEGFPDRMRKSVLCDAMVEAKALGSKAKGGLYRNGKAGPGRDVLQRLRRERGGAGTEPTRTEVIERLVYPMVDEAYRCLEDGVVTAEEDLDLGLVMGIGFPPFTGGITRWARSEGLDTIVAALERRAGEAGAGPCRALRDRATR